AGSFVGYENVIVVAKSGGDFTAVSAAVDAIGTDPDYPAASSTQRYLVWVAPGLYDDEHVVMKPFVDIEGSGQGVTVLRSIGGDTWIGASSATVVGADDAELRDLTVEIEPAVATHMTHAIFTEGSTTLRNVTANAVGGNYARGLMIHTGASPLMIDVIARASGGSQSNLGVDVYRATAFADGLFVEAWGGSEATGVFINEASSEVQLENVTTRVSDGTSQTHGLKTNLSDVTLEGYRTTVTSNATSSIGVWCDDQGRVLKVIDATIFVSTSAGSGAARGVYGSSCHLDVRNAVIDVVTAGGSARGIQHHQVTGTTTAADVTIADVEARAESGSSAAYGILTSAALGAAETYGRVTDANVRATGGSTGQSTWGIRQDAPGGLHYRGLSIAVGGEANFLYGIQAPRGASRFDDVVIDADGDAEATVVGAELYGADSAMTNARVRAVNNASGTGHDAVGVKSNSATGVRFAEVTAFAQAETNVWGADFFNSETTATRIEARAVSTDAALGFAFGVRCIGGSANIHDSIMHAASATGTSYGYRVDRCDSSVQGSEMVADGGVSNYGLSFTTTTAHTAIVKQSVLVGSTNVVVTAGTGTPDLIVQDATFSGGASVLTSGTQSCTAIVHDSAGIVFTPGPVSPCP
ncbi:MAG: hypothetical protein HKN44_16125, partial [Ilumatobacter sp.]|nr:hypothetical protein [Ilumatobacter sp.]